MDIYKESTPVSGTKVNRGDYITYRVNMKNIGSVKSNFVRITDDIPKETTYLPGSLKFVYDGQMISGIKQYAEINGTSFDTYYNFETGAFMFKNIRVPASSNSIEVTWPSGVTTYKAETIPANIVKVDIPNGVLLMAKNGGTISSTDLNTFFNGLSLFGRFGTSGNVNLKTNSQKNILLVYKDGNGWLDTNSGVVRSIQGKTYVKSWTAFCQNASGCTVDFAGVNKSFNGSYTHTYSSPELLEGQTPRVTGNGNGSVGLYINKMYVNPPITSQAYQGDWNEQLANKYVSRTWTIPANSKGVNLWASVFGSVNPGQTMSIDIKVNGQYANNCYWTEKNSVQGLHEWLGQSRFSITTTKNDDSYGISCDVNLNAGDVVQYTASRSGQYGTMYGGVGQVTFNDTADSNTGNPLPVSSYTLGTGDSFDIIYEEQARKFRITNITNQINGQTNVMKITIPNGLTLDNGTIGNGWWKSAQNGNVIELKYSGSGDSSQSIKNCLSALRFNGNSNTTGAISIEFGRNYQVDVSTTTQVPQVSRTTQNISLTGNDPGMGDDRWGSYTVPSNSGNKKYYVSEVIAYCYPTARKNGNAWSVTFNKNGGWLYGNSYTPSGYYNSDGWANDREFRGSVNVPAGSRIDFSGTKGGNHGALTANVILTTETTTYVDKVETHKEDRYQTLGNFSTNLPVSSGAAERTCKFVTTNGHPYVECVVPDVEVNKLAYMEFQVKVNDQISNGVSQIENTAYYETGWNNPGSPGTNTTKPKSPTNTTIHPLVGLNPNLVATKSSNPVSGSKVSRGDMIEYSINVQNTGNGRANYVVVRDNIPEHTEYAGGLNEGGVYIVNEQGGYVEWVFPLDAGQSRALRFNVKVKEMAPENITIRNIANFDNFTENPGEAGTTTVNPSKQTNEVVHVVTTIRVESATAFEVKKTSNPVSGTKINRGDTIDYFISVKADPNSGYIPWIMVKDIIPAGTTLISPMDYQVVNGDKAKIGVHTINRQDYQIGLVNGLEKGNEVIFSFKVKVNKETELTEIKNVALYDMYIEQPKESDTPTQTTNETVHPLTSHLVTAVKSATPKYGDTTENAPLVKRGQNITYTISVTNNGDGMANYVAIEDKIPAHTTFVSARVKATTNERDHVGLSVDDRPKISNFKDGEHIEGVLYDLAAGETREIELIVNVDDTTPQGTYIYNHALFDSSITNKYEGGWNIIDIPDDKDHSTNETIHMVDFMSHTLETGGEGWNNLIPIVGGTVLAIGLFVVIISKKKKDQ